MRPLEEKSLTDKILADAEARGIAMGFKGMFLRNFVERELATKTFPKPWRKRGKGKPRQRLPKPKKAVPGPAFMPKRGDDGAPQHASSHAVDWKRSVKEYNRQVEAARKRLAKIAPSALARSKPPVPGWHVAPAPTSFDPSTF